MRVLNAGLNSVMASDRASSPSTPTRGDPVMHRMVFLLVTVFVLLSAGACNRGPVAVPDCPTPPACPDCPVAPPCPECDECPTPEPVETTKPPGKGTIIGPASGEGEVTLYLDDCSTAPEDDPQGSIVLIGAEYEFQVSGVHRDVTEFCIDLDHTDPLLTDLQYTCACSWSEVSPQIVCTCEP